MSCLLSPHSIIKLLSRLFGHKTNTKQSRNPQYKRVLWFLMTFRILNIALIDENEIPLIVRSFHHVFQIEK
jgi:hypothetical protein